MAGYSRALCLWSVISMPHNLFDYFWCLCVCVCKHVRAYGDCTVFHVVKTSCVPTGVIIFATTVFCVLWKRG